LTGIDNAPFTNASMKGHWTMVFFGFTNCGSICPTTMAELGKMYHLLEKKSAKNLPQVVMISVDPERDNLDKLSHYVKAFDPHFYGARGDESAVNAMTKEMGVAYAKIATPTDANPQNYDIEHTGTVMLFNPNGELSAFFTMPHYASSLAKDYLMLAS
jgi:protein SCO1/2